MKHIFYTLLLVLGMSMVGCSSDEPNVNLPESLSEFISQYYPNQRIDSYTKNSSGCTVIVNDGPTIKFNAKNSWTSIDGNGSPIVQEFLFDQLPSPLYDYLETIDSLNQVFSISRDSKEYELKLLNSTLNYDIAKRSFIAR